MTQDPIATLLARTELFAQVPEDSLRTIAEGCVIKQVPSGEWVFRQGDLADEMYAVVDGECAVILGDTSSEGGAEKMRELDRILKGHHFGEASVLEEGRRNASVRAVRDTTLVAVPRSGLLAALNQSPGLALVLCQAFLRYLRVHREALLMTAYVDIEDSAHFPSRLLHRLSPSISIACRAVVIEEQGDRLTVGMVDPYDKPAREFLASVLEGHQLVFAAISQRGFEKVVAELLRSRIGAIRPVAFHHQFGYEDDQGEVSDFGEGPEADLLKSVLAEAINAGSSDIHFEPHRENHRIRIRIDGALLTLREGIDRKAYRRVVARLKGMSQLDVANFREPEDGRFVLVGDRDRIEVRIAVTPSLGGHKVALRVVDPKQLRRHFGSLFSTPKVEAMSREVLLGGGGLALVVGATGTGKTTTLYATLEALWERSKVINVITIENPIEYELPFATQLQVDPNSGLTFEKLLRHTLRQDPDVLFIGEIRDEESANIAAEAAGTGHMVLSSMHTDSVLEAIVRLRRLGVPPYLLAASLRGVISQRLLPRVCQACAAPVDRTDPMVRQLLSDHLIEEGQVALLRRGAGCERCRASGEQGRVAVFEMLKISDTVKRAIEGGAGSQELAETLDPHDYYSLREDVVELLSQGIINPERALSLFPHRRIRD